MDNQCVKYKSNLILRDPLTASCKLDHLRPDVLIGQLNNLQEALGKIQFI
jgi:hypothetical protein